MRRGLILISGTTAAVALGAVALAVRNAERTAGPRGPLVRSAGAFSGAVTVYPGIGGLFTPFHAHPTEDIVLDSADTVAVDQHVTVQMVRVTFVGVPGRTDAGRVRIGGDPGQQCLTWPPRGFGPTYPLGGLQVPAGQKIAFSIYITADRHGDRGARGLIVRYHSVRTGKRYTLRDGEVRSVLQMRTKAEWRVDRDAPCTPDAEKLWVNPYPSP